MISGSFGYNRKLKKVLPKSEISLKQVNKYLSKIDDYCENNGLVEKVSLFLTQDKISIFRDDVSFGDNNPNNRSIILLVQNTLNTVFISESESQKTALLQLITNELNEDLSSESEKESSLESEKKQSNKGFSPEKLIVVGGADPPATNRTVKKRSRTTKFKKLKQLNEFMDNDLRKVFAVVIAVLIVGTITFLFLSRPVPSYKSLIDKNDYQSAAEKYPKKTDNIENILLEKGDVDDLEEFNQQHETVEGKFDIAFLKGNWKNVVNSSNVKMNRARKAQLAVAYIKLHQPIEADKINAELDNNKLKQAIALEYIRTDDIGGAEKINKDLHNKNLDKLIEAGKSYQQLILKYDKELANKSLSKNERKKIFKNKTIWKNQLKTLGE